MRVYELMHALNKLPPKTEMKIKESDTGRGVWVRLPIEIEDKKK